MSDTDRRALALARRRVEESLPSSPEWAAAIEALVELETALHVALQRTADAATVRRADAA